MELSATNLFLPSRPLKPNPNVVRLHTRRWTVPQIRRPRGVSAIDGGSDFVPPEITWQITVGALAGVVPFVIAGIEFGKRIVAQKKCDICCGSGLVKNEERYTRCPGCGGFLPWQSWKRFFTG